MSYADATEPPLSNLDSYVPISQLSTYTPRWTIKAKVLEKIFQQFTRRPSVAGGSNINSNVSPSKNEGGRIMTVDLMDFEGDVIRSKFWGAAADKYDQVLQKGKIYLFKGGRVNVANKRFNNTQHAYELTFFENGPTCITPCEPIDGESNDNAPSDQANTTNTKNAVNSSDSPAQNDTPGRFIWPSKPRETNYKFVTVRDIKLANRPLPFIVDVIGVVQNVKPIESTTSRRNGEPINRRTLSIVDDSEHELEVTLWPPNTSNEDETFVDNPIIAFRGLQIREWRGRVGATISMTNVSFQPSTEEATRLKDWYKQNGSSVRFQSLRAEKGDMMGGGQGNMEFIKSASLSSITNALQSMSADDKLNFVTVAEISRYFLLNRDNEFSAVYAACPKCRRKVSEETISRALRRCENCNEHVTPIYRYNIALSLIDHTRGKFLLRAFHEACQVLIPVEAQTWKSVVSKRLSTDKDDELTQQPSETSSNDKKLLSTSEKLAEMFEHDAIWQRVKVKLRCRKEVFNGVTRNNVVATSIEKLNFEEHACEMLKDIWAVIPDARKQPTPIGFDQRTDGPKGPVKRRRLANDKLMDNDIAVDEENKDINVYKNAATEESAEEPAETITSPIAVITPKEASIATKLEINLKAAGCDAKIVDSDSKECIISAAAS